MSDDTRFDCHSCLSIGEKNRRVSYRFEHDDDSFSFGNSLLQTFFNILEFLAMKGENFMVKIEFRVDFDSFAK